MTNPLAPSYGVLERTQVSSDIDFAVEKILRVGYCVFVPGFTAGTVTAIARQFDKTQSDYLA